MSKKHNIFPLFRVIGAAGLLFAFTAPAMAQQQGQRIDPRLQREILYVQALVRKGYHSYANEVTKRLSAEYPGADIIVKEMEVELDLMLGKWKDVMAKIAKEPKDSASYWAMQLKMADYLFSYGRYYTDTSDKDKIPGAIDIYDQLMRVDKPPAAIADRYQDALFTYAQMLMLLGNDVKACDVYKRLMSLEGISSQAKRQFTFEYAQLLVKIAEKNGASKESGRLQLARDSIKGLLWSQDLWFGRSVALLAHIYMLEGKIPDALRTIEDYEDSLEQYDEMLIEAGKEDNADYSAMSPLAECRYLQGTMLMDDGFKKLEKAKEKTKEEKEAIDEIADAIDYLITVFSDYPAFAWAPDAMARVEEITTKLQAKGFKMDDPLTEEDRQRVAEKQFESARVAYNQNQFEEAIKIYQSALKIFPNKVPDSIIGYENLIRSAINLTDGDAAEKNPEIASWYELYAGAVLGHLAEHFSRHPGSDEGPAYGFQQKKGTTQAGNTLRSLNQFFIESGKPDLAARANELFFTNFQDHPAAAPSLLSVGITAYSNEDWTEATNRFTQMVALFPRNELSFRAQRLLAETYHKMLLAIPDDESHAADRKNMRNLEYETRRAYVNRVLKKEKPGNEAIQAQYALLAMLRDDVIADLRDSSYEYFEATRVRADENTLAPLREKVAKSVNAVVDLLDKRYAPLIDTLADSKKRKAYEATDEEVKFNDTILQRCYFDRAFCLASLHEPKEKEPEWKKQSIESYEAILGMKSADTNTIPRVLLQLGTLYSSMTGDDEAQNAESTKKADEYFSRLSAEYPASDEAKNALYLQGKTLLELGETQKGVKKFQEMFSAKGGKYSASQLAAAADVLLANKKYDEANQGYDAALALARDDERVLRAQIQLGKARVLMIRKEFKAASDMLKTFIDANRTSAKFVEASEMLIEASLAAALDDSASTEQARNDLFRKAIDAINSLRAYKKTDAEVLDLQLQMGKVMETQAYAEKKAGNEKGADKFLRQASGHYQKLFFSYEYAKNDLAKRQFQEEMLYRAASVLARMETYTTGESVFGDVKKECEDYIRDFPDGKNIRKIRDLLSQANAAISSGKAPDSSFLNSLDSFAPPAPEQIVETVEEANPEEEVEASDAEKADSGTAKKASDKKAKNPKPAKQKGEKDSKDGKKKGSSKDGAKKPAKPAAADTPKEASAE